MQLISQMHHWIETSESRVHAQLLREDVARLEKLIALVDSSANEAACLKDGLYIGWTQGDFTTYQLKPEIEALIAAVYAHETTGRTEDLNRATQTTWVAFHNARIEKLVHCK